MDLIEPHVTNDDERFPQREALVAYDFGQPDDTEWLVSEIVAHRWMGTREKDLEFLVLWSLGDSTWEPYNNCKDLKALDEYLELRGVKQPWQLPRLDKCGDLRKGSD